MRFAHHPYDLCQQRFATDSLRLHHQRPGPVHGAAGHALALLLFYWNRLAGDHRFINAARAVDYCSIDRNFFTRPYTQLVARLHLLQRHVVFAAIGFNQPRRFWGESQQCADRAGGLPARSQFEHLAQ